MVYVIMVFLKITVSVIYGLIITVIRNQFYDWVKLFFFKYCIAYLQFTVFVFSLSIIAFRITRHKNTKFKKKNNAILIGSVVAEEIKRPL